MKDGSHTYQAACPEISTGALEYLEESNEHTELDDCRGKVDIRSTSPCEPWYVGSEVAYIEGVDSVEDVLQPRVRHDGDPFRIVSMRMICKI